MTALLYMVAFSALVVALVRREWTMIRVCGVFLLNLLICAAVVEKWFREPGQVEPWAFYLAMDMVSASIILWPPARKMQAVIGTLYLALCALHVGYGINDLLSGYSYPATLKYYEIRGAIAVVQAILLAGWVVTNGHGKNGHRDPGRVPDLRRARHPSGGESVG